MFDIEKIRKDFPILKRSVYDKPLVYLDNAATTLKPQPVIDAIVNYYTNESANVHRGIHRLSVLATDRFEAARESVKSFLNAKSISEIVFTSGTTGSLNLIALSYGRSHFRQGDVVLLSEIEHHSNIVPWQILQNEIGIELRYIPMLKDGSLDISSLDELLDSDVKLVSVNWVSNSLGTINDIQTIIAKAHAVGAKVSIDAAQAVAHFVVDVQKLDCDFLSFSSHKLLGPTGIGVLYAKESILHDMPPLFGGGDMIKTVSLAGSTWNDLPFKFEAGTPHIEGVIGLGAAIEYIQKIGLSEIAQYEKQLAKKAESMLAEFAEIEMISNAKNKVGIFTFNMKSLHSTDVGSVLDQEGIAVRTGHHCTMPVMQNFGVAGSVRASFSFYNNEADILALKNALLKVKDFFY